MSTTTQRQSGKRAGVRRLAIYGGIGSGKTCILAALAMARTPNPFGYSCLWINDKERVPDVDLQATPQPSAEVLARFEGKRWLQNAISALEGGAVPGATELRVPYQLLYQFTSEGSQNGAVRANGDGQWRSAASTYVVETVDYAGELAKPSSTDLAMAQSLMEHLQTCDGLLILAEAPPRGKEYGTLHRELTVLAQALSLVSQRRQKTKEGPFPTALVLNKWDRYTEIDNVLSLTSVAIRPGQDRARKQAAVDEFQKYLQSDLDRFFSMSPPVPQHGLANVLKALAGGDDYFRVFPVSALGKCRQAEKSASDGNRVADTPIDCNPLRSFGLEDPFVWLCQTADAVALKRVNEEFAASKAWNVLPWIQGKTLRTLRECNRLSTLHPAQHPYSKEVLTAKKKGLALWAAQGAAALAAAVLVGCLAIMGAVATSDWRTWHAIAPFLGIDSQILPTDLEHARSRDAEDFLRTYSVPKWYRLISYAAVLPSRTANDLLPKVQERLRVWDQRNSEKVAALSDLGAQEDAIKKAATLADLERLKTDLEGKRFPAYLSMASDKQAALTTACTEKITLITKQEAVSHFKSEVASFLELRNYREAADRIRKGCNDEAVKREQQENFVNIVPTRLTEDVENLCLTGQAQWDTARAKVQDFVKDSNVRALLGDEKALQATALVDWIDNNKEGHSYNDCVTHPFDNAVLSQYLQQFPQGKHAPLVRQRSEYNVWANKPRTWKLTVKEIVVKRNGATAFTPAARVDLYCDGTLAASSARLSLPSDATVPIRLMGETAACKPTDVMKVKVTVTIIYKVGYDDIGTAEWKGAATDLIGRDSVDCNVTSAKTENRNFIRLVLDQSDALQEPVLSRYEEAKMPAYR